MMTKHNDVEVAAVLTALAEAQHHAESGNPAEVPGLAMAQQVVRELAGWPVEADSERM